jgi:hypothetical protein
MVTPAAILTLPFVLFLWMLPFLSDWTLGNDYAIWPIQHQMELLFSLKMGSFPLYIPGFAGGQSASALTLGQIFHPISHLASILPGYWHGKALEWNTFLMLLSLGAAHLLLFTFLLSLRLDKITAFVLSLITVYNLRMLDLFRYGASLESWTGFLFLSSAIGLSYLKKTLTSFFFIIGATYWLVCSGHPQMMYYGLLGACLFTLLAPYILPEILSQASPRKKEVFRFWLRTGSCILIGILLSSAYIIPFYFDFVGSNAGRVAQDYLWADGFRDSFFGTLNNFFYPLRADVHGVFGGSSLILIPALIPMLRLFRLRIPRVVWCTWWVCLFLFLYMQGARLPIHYAIWKYVPFASTFRVAGRISLVLPYLLMLLFAWASRANGFSIELFGLKRHVSPLAALAAVSLLVIVLYNLLPSSLTNPSTHYSAIALRKIPSWVEPVAFLLGVASLLLYMVASLQPRLNILLRAGVCVFAVSQLQCLFPYGTWVEQKRDTPSLAHMVSDRERDLSYPFLPGSGLASNIVMRHVKRAPMEPFLARLFSEALFAETNEQAYAMMGQDRSQDAIVLEGFKHPAEGNTMPVILEEAAGLELIHSSYNRLVFSTRSAAPRFFGLAYPYTGHWRAFVNDHPVMICRANGVTHGIFLPTGNNRVEFRYWSDAAFWGMALSCVAMILIAFMVAIHIAKNQVILISLGGLLFSILSFASWYHSLYSGRNMHTHYTWEEKPRLQPHNLACGKPSYTHAIHRRITTDISYSDPFLTYESSGRVVDGQSRKGSGLISNFEQNPMWFVDLQQPRDIGSIVIYENRGNADWNRRPLYVAVSNDKLKWSLAQAVTSSDQTIPYRIEFHPPRVARFVLIQASDLCSLALDEVEIYPPL